jgi:hypothetical protein
VRVGVDDDVVAEGKVLVFSPEVSVWRECQGPIEEFEFFLRGQTI